MCMLVKDHLRRNWRILLPVSVMFSTYFSFFLLFVPREVDGGNGISNALWLILCAYAVLSFAIQKTIDLNVVRVWRTLPLRESSLANLAWGISVLAPPLLLCPVVLPTTLFIFCFGSVESQPISSALLFLLLATCLSGLTALAGVLNRFVRARATTARNPRRSTSSSTSHPGRLILLAFFAGALMIYHAPSHWSGIRLSHLTGMCLAAGLTWKSYSMRSWLLEPAFGQGGRILEARTLENVPLCRGSVFSALMQDLKGTALIALFVVVCFAAGGCLLHFCMSWGGLFGRGGWDYKVLAAIVGLMTIVGAGMSVLYELRRVSMLGVVRTLPLTRNQCVLLLLSYPYAASLAAIPCAAIPPWLTGQGHLPMLLLSGFLLSAGLCPFGMYIRARFGRPALRSLVAVVLFLGMPGASMMLQAFDERLTLTSTPVLCASALILVALGTGGYLGLRRVVERNSEIYTRKIEAE